MLVLLITLLSRDIWKECLKATLHCLRIISQGIFLYLKFFPQCAGDPAIRYPKINLESGYINDTYLRKSEGPGYL